MSRGFSDYERERIYQDLVEQGRALFIRLGFQKTSIQDITKRAGIAQGTFYKFFDSKESLYFVILEQEELKLKEQFFKSDRFTHQDPKQAFKMMLRQMVQTIEQNPLIRDLYFGDHLEKLSRSLSPEMLKEHFNNDANSLLPLIEKFKSEGYLIEAKPEVIAGVIRSLFLLTFHEKEIGKDVYRETLDLTINLIVDGLIKEVNS